MTYDVSVVGLYILDVLGRPVERIPAGGAVEFIDEIRLTVAGTAGGTAVSCAKLGMACLAVGAVGDDEKADFIVSTLKGYGVDASRMQRVAGVPTSATMLNIRPNGERPALHQRGASDHLLVEADFYDAALDARFVHLGGTSLLRAMDGPASVAMMQAAKARGCRTSFDLIAATEETTELVRALLPYVDFFLPSEEEARVLSGRSDPAEMADVFLDQGAGCCAITLGEKGSYLAAPDARWTIAPLDVDLVDTTGCGDGYSAGFLAGLKAGLAVPDCARLATAAASLVATGLGSDAGIRDLEQTRALMQEVRARPA